jgi:CRISPR-associated protein Cas2
MSYRFMRVLVFFDLPVVTTEDRRNYRLFRKGLIQNGFLMLQESVYCRMVLNRTTEASVLHTIWSIRPPHGLVQVLTVTEKQFAGMRLITGKYESDVVDSDQNLVIL